MECSQCGNEMQKLELFCPKCGHDRFFRVEDVIPFEELIKGDMIIQCMKCLSAFNLKDFLSEEDSNEVKI